MIITLSVWVATLHEAEALVVAVDSLFLLTDVRPLTARSWFFKVLIVVFFSWSSSRKRTRSRFKSHRGAVCDPGGSMPPQLLPPSATVSTWKFEKNLKKDQSKVKFSFLIKLLPKDSAK